MRARMAILMGITQAILFAVHWFVYATWMSLTGAVKDPGVSATKLILLLLSVSFVITSLLAFRYSNYTASNPLHHLCRLAWDVKLLLPCRVLILAYLCRDSASWLPVSQTNDRALVFSSGRVCERVRRHQCPLDSRETNFCETPESPGIHGGDAWQP